MSDYRDDTQETLVISDSLWAGSRGVAEEMLRITASVVFGMGAMASDAMAISDEVIDRRVHVISDSVQIADESVGSAKVVERLADVLRAADAAPGRLRVLHEDVLTINDDAVDHAGAVLSDAAVIADEVIDARRASQLVADQLRVADKSWQPARQMVEDHLNASVSVLGYLRASALLTDALAVADEVQDARGSPDVLTDTFRAADDTWGVLSARDSIGDTAVIMDHVIQPGHAAGQVWTAPTGNWAMSRYAPAQAEQLAVINGVVHAVTPEGVFALDGDGEEMDAEVRTGLLDIGQGSLALLDAAYVEYELDGAASMTVNLPQTGQMQSWTYTLPAELAGTLTNGRFKFGRGLRGRHFSFVLRLDGTRGYINDWQTLFAKSQRRI